MPVERKGGEVERVPPTLDVNANLGRPIDVPDAPAPKIAPMLAQRADVLLRVGELGLERYDLPREELGLHHEGVDGALELVECALEAAGGGGVHEVCGRAGVEFVVDVGVDVRGRHAEDARAGVPVLVFGLVEEEGEAPLRVGLCGGGDG
ncbi:hypothetical protein H0H92_006381 [Tricholoma furcatifolium]|nr:hypothetical protein H0H92_006381 [Tricholoma furcatifolium]